MLPQLLKYTVFDLDQFVTRDDEKLSEVGGLGFLMPKVPRGPLTLFLRPF